MGALSVLRNWENQIWVIFEEMTYFSKEKFFSVYMDVLCMKKYLTKMSELILKLIYKSI